MNKLRLFKDINKTSIFFWGFIIIVVLLGIIIRFQGLGKWPLALDEYFIVKSAENILLHGLPQFPSGGYYVRGILIQYLIAPLISFGIKAEFAGRIYSLVANLITIPAVYLIAKKIANRNVAALAVIIFSFSIWEIEFARFARMYAPFQAFATWYMYFAIIIYENKDFRKYKYLLFLTFISIFVYEGSIFLAAFNFIPFILHRKINYKYLLFALFILAFSIFFIKFDFRNLNVNPIYPPELKQEIIESNTSSPIRIPKLLLPFAFESILSSILTISLLIANVFLFSVIIKNLSKINFWSILTILLLVISAFLHQFGLFVITLIIALSWKLLEIDFRNKKMLIGFLLIFFINFFYWYLFGILTADWYVLYDDFSSFTLWGISKRLLMALVNYPYNYISLLTYFRALPVLTVLSIISLLALLLYQLFIKKENENINFVIGSVLFVGLLVMIPTLLYDETRYTFFLVPLVQILVISSIFFHTKLIFKNNSFKNLTFTIITISIFIISKDFNLYHLVNIDKPEVNYRMIYDDNMYKKHLYRRWDVLTPANYVKEHAGQDDLIMANENSHEYYLPRLDYYNFNYKHRTFAIMTRDYGTKETWTNAKLIYTNESLIDFIENNDKAIWFTVYPENWLTKMNFYERYKDYMVFEGVDKMIKVYYFPPKLGKINK